MSFKTLIDDKKIAARVRELGVEITKFYQAKKSEKLLVIGVLKGSFIFLADLVRELRIPCEIDFLEASSYGAATVSSGEVKLKRDVGIPVTGRDVLLVEDIVDTGLTISYLLKHLKLHGAKSVAVCSFLDKPSRRKTEVKADFLGFTIEDHFVVGYGLDYNNLYREIGSVVILEPEDQ